MYQAQRVPCQIVSTQRSTLTHIPAYVVSAHPYVLCCEKELEDACQDPLFNAPHLRVFVDFLLKPSSQRSLESYTEGTPFAWSYTYSATGALHFSSHSRSRDFDLVERAGRDLDNFDLVFLNGHPSSSWLNTIGHKYKVDMRFFQQHLRSIRPTVQHDEPSLPSSSRHTLKLVIPTIGDLSNAKDMFGVISDPRLLLAEDLRTEFLKNVHRTPVGRPIVRNAYLHNRKQFTLLQEVSMCVLQDDIAKTSTAYHPCVCHLLTMSSTYLE